eukprot:Skav200835  [mRNA]  locus=scaffold3034:166613:169025:- [translate_table: standard]
MSKAARARSLLYVPPQKGKGAPPTAGPGTAGSAGGAGAGRMAPGELSSSMSSTLGVSKPSRSQPKTAAKNGKKIGTESVESSALEALSPNRSPSATLTEEELARRDSSPPSFLCGRSFGRSDGIPLPLRSKDRHMWERSLSPDARANRASLISFGKQGCSGCYETYGLRSVANPVLTLCYACTLLLEI